MPLKACETVYMQIDCNSLCYSLIAYNRPYLEEKYNYYKFGIHHQHMVHISTKIVEQNIYGSFGNMLTL